MESNAEAVQKLVANSTDGNAHDLIDTYLSDLNNSAAAYRELLAAVVREQRWADVRHVLATATVLFPDEVFWLQAQGRLAESDGDGLAAAQCFDRLREARPERSAAWAGACRARLSLNDFASATDIATKGLLLHPDAQPIRQALFTALERQHRWEELDAALHAEPLTSAIAIRLAESASLRWDIDEAVRRWQHAVDLARSIDSDSDETNRALAGLFDSLKAAGRFAEAEQIVDDRLDADTNPTTHLTWLLRRGDLHCALFEFREAALVYQQADSPNAPDWLRVAAFSARAFVAEARHDDPVGLHRLLAEGQERLADESLGTPVAELLVAASLLDSATSAIERETAAQSPVPSNTQLRLEAWLASRTEAWSEAKRLERQRIAEVFHPAIHSEVDLTLVSGDASFEGGEILCFVVEKDEATRLPDFLRHYRELGVDRFVIVDNDSTDGSAEFLASQADVVLFSTAANYAEAAMGMRWINHLIAELRTRNWCVIADADELLVYPHYERHPLPELTAYLDVHGFEAVAGFLLDMHAERPSAEFGYEPGARLLEHCPFFTNRYAFQPVPHTPYRAVRGGFRHHVLGIEYREHTKTPLVLSTAQPTFLESTHEALPLRVADVTAALLHFKFVGDAEERSESENSWMNYSYFASRQAALAKSRARRSTTSDVSYLSDAAVRFESSQQLADLGLLEGLDWIEGSGQQSRAAGRHSAMFLPPRLSVVMAARNAEETIADSIVSLQAQDFEDWNLVVVDDGSTDRTAAIVRSMTELDHRITMVRGAKNGPGAARNVGAEHATGAWLAMLDSDDLLHPDHFEKLFGLVDSSDSPIEFAFSAGKRFWEDGSVGPTETTEPNDLFVMTARANQLFLHGCMLTRSLFWRAGGFDERLITCEDWDLWQRVARFAPARVHLEQPTALYRMRPDSLSRDLEQLLTDGRQVIERGQKSDTRLPEQQVKWRDGFDAPGFSIRSQIAFEVWVQAIAAGSSKEWPASTLLTESTHLEQFGSSALSVAGAIAAGIQHGLCLPPSSSKSEPTRRAEEAVFERLRNAFGTAFLEEVSTMLRDSAKNLLADPTDDRTTAVDDAAALEVLASIAARLISPDELVIDGGAASGAFTARLIEHGANVTAVEPNPHFGPVLARKFGNDSRFSYVDQALVENSRQQTTELQVFAGQPWRAGIRSAHANTYDSNAATFSVIEVPATTIDQLWGDAADRPIGFIKLALAGNEIPALIGARSVLMHQRPIVGARYFKRSELFWGNPARELSALLDDVGYQMVGPEGSLVDTPMVRPFVLFCPSERVENVRGELRSVLRHDLALE